MCWPYCLQRNRAEQRIHKMITILLKEMSHSARMIHFRDCGHSDFVHATPPYVDVNRCHSDTVYDLETSAMSLYVGVREVAVFSGYLMREAIC